MENLIVLLFDIILWSGYLIGAIALGLLIQLISYRVFKFNLYKWLCYNLIDKELRK